MTEHPKLDYIHKQKLGRGKRRWSSYEKYLNKGCSCCGHWHRSNRIYQFG